MRRAPAAAVAARPEQPALHIKRTNEGRGGEMKKMACSRTHHGRGRRWPAAVVRRRRLRHRTSMARLG